MGKPGSDAAAGLAGWLTVIATGLVAVGSFLPWAKVSIAAQTLTLRGENVPIPDLKETVKGTAGFEGWLVIGAGIGLAALCFAFFNGDIAKLRGALFEGLFIGGVAAWVYFGTLKNAESIIDAALGTAVGDLTSQGVPADLAAEVIDKVGRIVEFNIGIGFWLVVASAGVAVLAGIFAFMAAGSK